MTITPGIAKRLRAFIQDSLGRVPTPLELEGRFLLQKLEPQRSTKPKSKRPAALEREAKRLARQRQEDEFRYQVMNIANDWCELRGNSLNCSHTADEAHHVISGSGMRQKYESPLTGVALCRADHNAAHRGEAWALRKLLEIMQRRGQTFAAQCLQRRIDKKTRAA